MQNNLINPPLHTEFRCKTVRGRMEQREGGRRGPNAEIFIRTSRPFSSVTILLGRQAQRPDQRLATCSWGDHGEWEAGISSSRFIIKCLDRIQLLQMLFIALSVSNKLRSLINQLPWRNIEEKNVIGFGCFASFQLPAGRRFRELFRRRRRPEPSIQRRSPLNHRNGTLLLSSS